MANPEAHVKWQGQLIILFILVCGMLACKPVTDEPVWVHQSDPNRFVAMLHPADNPLSVEGIALGKKLFFDPGLSGDGTISCASCHRPEKAFSDGLVTSKGIKGRRGLRNTPSLLNAGYFYRGLFWDSRAKSLEELVLHPVADQKEMGAEWTGKEIWLGQNNDYRILFKKAFPEWEENKVPRVLVAKALSQYLRTLVSSNSKFDMVQRGEASFTASEKRGWAIFFDASDDLPQGECGHCHVDPLFTDLKLYNTGLDPEGKEKDSGRNAISKRLVDRAKFRTPSLRNVTLTAPYMHDGRFENLEAVIDHYNRGGHPGDNVSPNVRELGMEAGHRADLVAFLTTLTDSVYAGSKYIAIQ